jgi:AGZA family xanthine/uracil permease-like MFS transporter
VIARLGVVATVLVTFSIMLGDFFDTMGTIIIVGFYMMSVVREIAWDDYEDAIPAFVTMLAMPFTWSITNGIGAGFVTHVALRVLNGRGGQVHWMLYLSAAAFVVYFVLSVLERHLT